MTRPRRAAAHAARFAARRLSELLLATSTAGTAQLIAEHRPHPLTHALLFGATAAGCALRYAAHTRPTLGAISARTDT